jgi:4-diphosphocytidyl-2-C-methyl-D-erythritol kinase
MLPVEVYDDVAVTLGTQGIALQCGHGDVPEDGRNLAWRAAEAFLEEAGWPCGVRIRLEKRIPVGAGLGGGSADAAAVLLLLSRLLPGALEPPRLASLARHLGADVPFFLWQRPALATGIGERLRWVQGLPSYPLVLVKPPIMVTTRDVYLRLALTRGESRINLKCLLAQPWDLQHVMENDLESVTLADYPELGEIKERLRSLGAIGVLMSGSGPTVFGVFRDGAHAAAAARAAADAWPASWVCATRVATASPSVA